MYEQDLALNNLQWLICYKPNQTNRIIILITSNLHSDIVSKIFI